MEFEMANDARPAMKRNAAIQIAALFMVERRPPS